MRSWKLRRVMNESKTITFNLITNAAFNLLIG